MVFQLHKPVFDSSLTGFTGLAISRPTMSGTSHESIRLVNFSSCVIVTLMELQLEAGDLLELQAIVV